MRLNERAVLRGGSVVLVPYRREHCEVYHHWMQDPELLELTGSEPLSLAEEVANQQSWWIDDAKLTFIVCMRDADAATNPASEDLTRGMVGDVNAFFSAVNDDETEAAGAEASGHDTLAKSLARLDTAGTRDVQNPALQAELEVMVAEAAQRRKGVGRDALLMLIQYILLHLPQVTLFVAK
jgi:RimJ/RimL family protein N-acetyltransferase